MTRGPYRTSRCASDCSGTSHGDTCPAEDEYWHAHERDRRRASAAAQVSHDAQDDASIRFSLMELD